MGEKRTHYHNKSLFICTQAQAIPTPPPTPPQKNSLWSVVTPIKPAKPSLSGRAADLRTPRQQIGLGEGLQPDKGGSLPLLLYLKSITLAFTFSVSPHLPPSPAPLPALLSLSAVTVGLGQLPNRVPMLNRQSPPFQDESHPGHTVSDKAVMWGKD